MQYESSKQAQRRYERAGNVKRIQLKFTKKDWSFLETVERVGNEEFGSTSAYIKHLLREDLKRRNVYEMSTDSENPTQFQTT